MQLVSSALPYTVYLLDVCQLRQSAFSTPGEHMGITRTLKELLEDETVEILLWDCRCDNGALLHQFGVRIASVVDLQLCELAWRLNRYEVVNAVGGLGWTLENRGVERAELTHSDVEDLARYKSEAKSLFAPDLGGSYEVWKARPLPDVLLHYSTDARTFFALRRFYSAAEATHANALKAATQRRLVASSSVDYESRSPITARAVDEQLKNEIHRVLPPPPPRRFALRDPDITNIVALHSNYLNRESQGVSSHTRE